MTSAKARARSGERGAVLVEALITLPPMLLLLAANLELVRRAHLEVVLHQAAFLSARRPVLGEQSGTGRRVREWVYRSLGEAGGRRLWRRMDHGVALETRGAVSRVHLRYPALVRFPYRDHTKHHFEITHRCTFPF